MFTADTHSQLYPFPDTAPEYPGLGGVQGRADMIRDIRKSEPNTVLLDAGDFFQGGILFDTFRGVPEIEAMNRMGYDAAGIGEHEFDGGADNLAARIREARFGLLCANYTFLHPDLREMVRPFTVLQKEGIRVGVFALGSKPLRQELNKVLSYQDPVAVAEQLALHLKHQEKCDLVICLSRLGLSDKPGVVNDKKLARDTTGIDLIIGGQSHHLTKEALRFFNREKKEILVAHAGWGGTHLGRIDYTFSHQKIILSANAQTVEIGK